MPPGHLAGARATGARETVTRWHHWGGMGNRAHGTGHKQQRGDEGLAGAMMGERREGRDKEEDRERNESEREKKKIKREV